MNLKSDFKSKVPKLIGGDENLFFLLLLLFGFN